MKHVNHSFILTITSLTLLFFIACKGSNDSSPVVAINTDTCATPAEEEFDETVAMTDDEAISEEISEPEPNPTHTETTVTKSKGQSKPSYGGKETLYISTYGANGKVWGHVTMNGNTGRGTIHDEDENTYTITVTRHGGELYGTDQNGRQYVFRM